MISDLDIVINELDIVVSQAGADVSSAQSTWNHIRSGKGGISYCTHIVW
jgi:hypothetical protein